MAVYNDTLSYIHMYYVHVMQLYLHIICQKMDDPGFSLKKDEITFSINWKSSKILFDIPRYRLDSRNIITSSSASPDAIYVDIDSYQFFSLSIRKLTVDRIKITDYPEAIVCLLCHERRCRHQKVCH